MVALAMVTAVLLRQEWAITEPEGPHWLFNLGEQTSQVVPETNPPK